MVTSRPDASRSLCKSDRKTSCTWLSADRVRRSSRFNRAWGTATFGLPTAGCTWTVPRTSRIMAWGVRFAMLAVIPAVEPFALTSALLAGHVHVVRLFGTVALVGLGQTEAAATIGADLAQAVEGGVLAG